MDDGDPCRRIVQRVSTSRALTTRQGQQDLGSELARAGPWHRCRAGRSLAKVWSKQILGTGQPSQSLVMKGLVQASKLSAGFPEIDRINMRNITKCMNLLASHSAPPGWLLTPGRTQTWTTGPLLGPGGPWVFLRLKHQGTRWRIQRVGRRPVDHVEAPQLLLWAEVGPGGCVTVSAPPRPREGFFKNRE